MVVIPRHLWSNHSSISVHHQIMYSWFPIMSSTYNAYFQITLDSLQSAESYLENLIPHIQHSDQPRENSSAAVSNLIEGSPSTSSGSGAMEDLLDFLEETERCFDKSTTSYRPLDFCPDIHRYAIINEVSSIINSKPSFDQADVGKLRCKSSKSQDKNVVWTFQSPEICNIFINSNLKNVQSSISFWIFKWKNIFRSKNFSAI